MSGVLLSIAILQVLTILAGLLRAKGLALLLGPAGFGVVSTIDQVVVTLVTLGGLALPFTAMKFMSRGHSEGEAFFRRTGSGFLRLLTLLAVITTLIASIVVALMPALFGDDLVVWHRVLQLAVLGVPSAMLLILFVNILAAAQRPAAAAAANLIGIAALGIAAVAGAAWRGLDGLYTLSVGVAVVTTFVGFAAFSRGLGIRLGAAGAGVVASLRERPEIIGYSACFYAMMGASSVTLLLVRTVVLAQLGAVAAGQLQAAFSIALTVGAVLMPVSNLYLAPLVNRAAPTRDKLRIAHSFAARMLVLLLLGALPVALFPGFLLRLLFTQAFTAAAAVLWLFVLWQCVFQLVYVYQQLLIGLDDVVFAAGMSVAGFGTAIALAGPLVQSTGLGGVALALASGMALTGAGILVRLRLRYHSRLPSGVAFRFLGVLLIIAAAGRLFTGRSEFQTSGLLPRLGYGVFSLCLAWLALDREERNPRLWLAAVRRSRAAATAP